MKSLVISNYRRGVFVGFALKILFVGSLLILLYLMIGILLSTEKRRTKWTDDLIQRMAYTSLSREGKAATGENLCLRIEQLQKYREQFEKRVDTFLILTWLLFFMASIRERLIAK